MDDKTVRSWVVPGFFAVFCGLVFIYLSAWLGPSLVLLIPLGFGMLALAVMVTEYLNYVRDQTIQRAERERISNIRTADGYLAEQMRGLASQSPELANAIAQRVGRPDLILFPGIYGRKPQVVIAGSDITLRFALYALSRSDEKAMVAQRDFQDSTYHWDTNGEVTDRQQWMQLNWLLSQQSMCTRYVPGQKVNHPPLWMPPWTPERIITNWLLGDVLEEFKPYLRHDEEESLNEAK